MEETGLSDLKYHHGNLKEALIQAGLDILREELGPHTLISFAKSVTKPEEEITTVTLGEATPEMADMRTMVIVGSRGTKRIGRWVYTPRSAS